MAGDDDTETIVRNTGAYHDYFVHDEYEAGVRLVGTEIESLKERRVDLADAYAKFDENELYLVDARIAEYPGAAPGRNHDPVRPRKLLLHRKQLNRLETKTDRSGYTLIPLELYFKQDHVKVRLGLCEGKKQFHKQRAEKRRREARQMARDHARIRDEMEHKYDEQS